MIAIGSDHGGFELKEVIKKHLEGRGFTFEDFGTLTGEAVDYPDIAEAVCKPVAEGKFEFGILVCGTGIGISIAANKVDGIRAAHVTDPYSSEKAKQHNNANVITLGGRITGSDLALKIVDAYIDAEFEGGRHQARVDKIMKLEG